MHEARHPRSYGGQYRPYSGADADDSAGEGGLSMSNLHPSTQERDIEHWVGQIAECSVRQAWFHRGSDGGHSSVSAYVQIVEAQHHQDRVRVAQKLDGHELLGNRVRVEPVANALSGPLGGERNGQPWHGGGKDPYGPDRRGGGYDPWPSGGKDPRDSDRYTWGGGKDPRDSDRHTWGGKDRHDSDRHGWGGGKDYWYSPNGKGPQGWYDDRGDYGYDYYDDYGRDGFARSSWQSHSYDAWAGRKSGGGAWPPAGGHGSFGRGDLFVGKLGDQASEGMVRDIFEKAGFHTALIKVPTGEGRIPRGYAFVSLVDPSRREQAIARLNGHRVNDRSITVAVSDSGEGPSGCGSKDDGGKCGKKGRPPPMYHDDGGMDPYSSTYSAGDWQWGGWSKGDDVGVPWRGGADAPRGPAYPPASVPGEWSSSGGKPKSYKGYFTDMGKGSGKVQWGKKGPDAAAYYTGGTYSKGGKGPKGVGPPDKTPPSGGKGPIHKPQPGPQAPASNQCVAVYDVPPHLGSGGVWEALHKHGEIKDIHMLGTEGCPKIAFVFFVDADKAAEVVEKANASSGINIAGVRVRLELFVGGPAPREPPDKHNAPPPGEADTTDGAQEAAQLQ